MRILLVHLVNLSIGTARLWIFRGAIVERIP